MGTAERQWVGDAKTGRARAQNIQGGWLGLAFRVNGRVAVSHQPLIRRTIRRWLPVADEDAAARARPQVLVTNAARADKLADRALVDEDVVPHVALHLHTFGNAFAVAAERGRPIAHESVELGSRLDVDGHYACCAHQRIAQDDTIADLADLGVRECHLLRAADQRHQSHLCRVTRRRQLALDADDAACLRHHFLVLRTTVAKKAAQLAPFNEQVVAHVARCGQRLPDLPA
eukprot:7381843-Prymnesium_polylepis.1